MPWSIPGTSIGVLRAVRGHRMTVFQVFSELRPFNITRTMLALNDNQLTGSLMRLRNSVSVSTLNLSDDVPL